MHAVENVKRKSPQPSGIALSSKWCGNRGPSVPAPVSRIAHDFSRIPIHVIPLEIRPRLTVSTPGDVDEQEAERVAERVMRMPESSADVTVEPAHPHAGRRLMRKGLFGGSCESAPRGTEEEEKQQDVMRKSASAGPAPVNDDAGALLARSRGGGEALSGEIRTFMEPRFRHDFSDVRIHIDGNAARMAKGLHAEAFTSGRDIFFGSGRYAPETAAGKRLLAHELTHIVQQRSGRNVGQSTRQQRIRRYRLRGFPPAEAAAMHAAIRVAASKVIACPQLGLDRSGLMFAIKNKRYDYVEDLGLCGWTFPSSWYVEIGKLAFSPGACCDLASTIAHEVSHTRWFRESTAQKLECNCFGCSC